MSTITVEAAAQGAYTVRSHGALCGLILNNGGIWTLSTRGLPESEDVNVTKVLHHTDKLNAVIAERLNLATKYCLA